MSKQSTQTHSASILMIVLVVGLALVVISVGVSLAIIYYIDRQRILHQDVELSLQF